MKTALGLLATVIPLLAGAQPIPLRPLSIGDAMQEMERLHALKESRPPPVEQTFVYPERPGQNQVAWFDFDWRHYDIPSPAGGPGGIRLYFYERERDVAGRALPSIRASYLRLVDQFHYSPTKRIPYILYSSHREFQATNVFQVTESVLGVTSPEDLQMSLPYFGDHERFREVSTHELVHQFMIQKLDDLAESEDVETAIGNLPLWFIEGIAEYYTKGGLDPEADLYLRDLVWNPDPEERYEVVPFAEDRIRGYIPTYKLGQARVTFIADVYGEEKIQAFLENAHLVGGSFGGGGGPRAFEALVRRVLNEDVDQVNARWQAWLKRRYYPQYMALAQDLPSVRQYKDLRGEPDEIDVSADGNLVFFRGLDRDNGRVRLYLMDARRPRGGVEVAEDGKPGIESLHPIDHDILALTDGVLAFAAQAGAGDALYVQTFQHTAPQGKAPRIKLGKRHRLKVRHPAGLELIEISDLAFSTDGSHLAFVGLTPRGQKDIYVVPTRGGEARQITDDAYAERHLAWGRDGIYCASDSTDHGGMNLFRIDQATGARTRLTTSPAGDAYPRPQADGSVLFVSRAGGKPDLWLLQDGATRRLTDFATGLTSPAAAPGGRGVYASTFYRGRFRLVEVPKVALLKEAPQPVAVATAPVLEIPREDIPPDVPEYRSRSARNWRPEAGFVYGGGGSDAVAGRAALLFSDLLRDNVLYVELSVYGSWDYTQGLFLLENRARRASWILGGFHFVQQQIDRLDPSLSYFQRDFGVVGAIRYPLDRFRRVEAEVTLSGIHRYCLTDFAADLPVYCEGAQVSRPVADEWDSRNGGVNFQVTPALRYGYDTTRYDRYTGPLRGRSLLLELGGGWVPGRSALHGFARADGALHWPLVGRSNLTLRLASGTSFAPDETGRSWARSWWVTSADNLRGFYPLDLAYLIGQHFYVANAELQIPLNPFIRFFLFEYVEGIAALDFGGVFNRWEDRREVVCAEGGSPCQELVVEPGAWESRTLTGVLGANVLFGPLLFRIHFGYPFDIGGQLTPAQQAGDRWVTNFTLRWFFF